MTEKELSPQQQLERVEAQLESQAKQLEVMANALRKEQRVGKRVVRQVTRMARQVSQLMGVFDPAIDAAFLEVVEPLVKTRRTMLGYDRLFTLWQAASNVACMRLPAVEVGTFLGGSAALLAQALRRFGDAECELEVIDTFEGHVDSTISRHDSEVQRGKFQGISYEEVGSYLAAFPGVQVHKGDATVVIQQWPDRQYSLVHVDVDLYKPTLNCLKYFGPRLADGGVLIVDDYGSPNCPGIAKAITEFLSNVAGFQRWQLQSEQIVLIKTAQ